MIVAEAPSNIALIKYMGKNPNAADLNRPTNPSLSFTLDHLRSRVEIESLSAGEDRWQSLQKEGWLALDLPSTGQKKFLDFFRKLKSAWGIQGSFLVKSANNFPAGAGIASSASSFAALTLATAQLSGNDFKKNELADWSRQGSGSSGRSLFSGYCQWDAQGFSSVGETWPRLSHDLIVLEESHKLVSSSEAHLLVRESSQFVGRLERVDQRMRDLYLSFAGGDWELLAQTVWDEFWDMHTLFHTCMPPFFYMTADSLAALQNIQRISAEFGQGRPLITMDAGPNIHLLYLPHQAGLREKIREELKSLKWIYGPK